MLVGRFVRRPFLGDTYLIGALAAVALTTGVGCKNGPSESACEDLCTELVDVCAYEAFPDRASCMQGCLYSSDVGADLDGQRECVLGAACDTFTIVECEHAFGVE